MKFRRYWGQLPLLVAVVLAIGGCRSEFEKIRLTTDPEKLLEAANTYYEKGEYLRAQTLFELVLSQYRGRPEAEQLFFRYAYTHYHLRQFTLAGHYFNNFSATFAYSPLREEADYMSAYSSYQLSPGFRLDQKETLQAIQGFQDFVNRYPSSPRVTECNRLIDDLRQKLEDKAYANAELYFNIGYYEAAIQSFENMLRDFPDTDKMEFVRYRILKSAYLFATKSIYERRKERYEQTIDKYTDFKRKFPQSNYLAEAESIYRDCQTQIKNLNQ